MRPEVVKTYPFIDTWRSTGYQYYIIPKDMLETGPEFGLGIDEAVLYSILRDRTKLSYKNNWIDTETNRIYIIYPREEAANYIGFSKRKTIDVFARLIAAGLLKEEAQKTRGSVLNKPKKIYVRQWAAPSVLHSAEELKNDGFCYYTEDNIYADTGPYFIIPRVLFEEEAFHGLNLRAILLYSIALDSMHKSITYGKVDENGLVWCTLNNKAMMQMLGCTDKPLKEAYDQLEALGLMVRTWSGGTYRVYLRDYMPPAGSAQPEAKHPDTEILHPGIGESAPGIGNPAPGNRRICIRDSETLHPEMGESARGASENLHPSQSFSHLFETKSLETNIGAGAPDVPEKKKEDELIRDSVYDGIQRQIEYREFCEDISICEPVELTNTMYEILDMSIRIMAEDAMAPGLYIRIGDKVIEKKEALLRYRDMDRYILYTLLQKVSERWADITSKELYLHRSLLKAVEDHAGAAYYTKLYIRNKRDAAAGCRTDEGVWPW